MSGLGNKEIFAKNLRYYIDRSGKTQKDFADIVGVAYSTFNDWVNAKKYPRIDKIEILANYFGIQKSDLIEEKITEEKEKDNDAIADLIVRIRSDKPLFNVIDALARDEEFLAAVKALCSLEGEQKSSVSEMLKTFSK